MTIVRYHLARCTIEIHQPPHAQYVRTIFDDGQFCFGIPCYGTEDVARAAALGYNDDVWRMHQEHEILHSLLAEAQGLTYSPALRYHIDGPPERGVIPREEATVFLLQRALNVGRTILEERRAPA